MKNNTKRSYGIACFRWNKKINEIQLLLIKKKYTYAFTDFLYGNYNINDSYTIKQMLNNMNAYEKSLLLSKDFSKMWYHVFNIDPDKQETDYSMVQFYNTKKKIYDKKITMPVFIKLKQYIHQSFICNSSWEIPKGKKNQGELPLDCALREFEEETGLSPMDLCFTGYDTYSYIITTKETKYVMEYYITTIDISCRYPNQINYLEIDDIRWMTRTEIENCDRSQAKHLSSFVNKLFKIVKQNKFITKHL